MKLVSGQIVVEQKCTSFRLSLASALFIVFYPNLKFIYVPVKTKIYDYTILYVLQPL